MPQTSVISQDANAVTVRLSRRRWSRIQKLEETYKLACAIRRGMKQAETAPAMSFEEAVESLRAL
ncbi:MAG: hypothetical protein J1E58_09530 [Prevotella sp.]|nr:hypothetical protein [Prevotella sp.]